MFIIYDWANNDVFSGKLFDSFDIAEEYLTEFLGDIYEIDRQEYSIEECP